VPLLLPALALWGWQADLLPWALVMGVLLEASRLIRLRLDIPVSDFNRLWNFSTLLFLGVGLYLFLAREGLSTVGTMVNSETLGGRLDGMREISLTALNFLRWLPFVLFPFVLAQAWSRLETLPWSTFSLYAQAQAARQPEATPPEWTQRQVHPGYPYLALVLFASSAANSHPEAYLPAFLVVLVLAVWPWRNPRFGWVVRASLLLVLFGVALLTQRGLNQLREAWQTLEGRLLQSAGAGNYDQLRNVTALGVVGKLKQSGRIILRLQTTDNQAPGLLREGIFNRFRGQAWSTSHRQFTPVGTATEGNVWRIVPGRRAGSLLTLSRYTSQGEVPIALPGRVLAVRDLPVLAVETNYLAAARLREGPPLAVYTVEVGEGGGFDGPPEADDTDLESLAPADQETIREIGRELGLPGQDPATAIRTVERFFASGFEYSLWQRPREGLPPISPVAEFLRETRAGHCEFFATATVLLLRTAGVPSRYVVGFSPEQRQGDDWLARGRDAHAWCLAYVEGRWQEIDTTPGIWREREQTQAGWWEGLGDLLSHGWYRFAVWRQEGGNWQLAVFTAGMLVLSWLAWRQLRGSRWRRSRTSPSSTAVGSPAPGLDSELYPFIRHLEQSQDTRQPQETLTVWFRRLGLTIGPSANALQEALRLHQRLRFDPRGLPEPDRNRLRELVQVLTGAVGRSERER